MAKDEYLEMIPFDNYNVSVEKFGEGKDAKYAPIISLHDFMFGDRFWQEDDAPIRLEHEFHTHFELGDIEDRILDNISNYGGAKLLEIFVKGGVALQNYMAKARKAGIDDIFGLESKNLDRYDWNKAVDKKRNDFIQHYWAEGLVRHYESMNDHARNDQADLPLEGGKNHQPWFDPYKK